MITRCGKTFLIYRRVPARYGQVDSRTFVKMSLGTDSEELANVKAPAIWQQLVEGWEAKLAGQTADAEQAFAAAQELADRRGFRYLPAARVAELPSKRLSRERRLSRRHQGSSRT